MRLTFDQMKTLGPVQLEIVSDDKLKVTKVTQFGLDGLENIRDTAEMVVTDVFPFPTMFSKPFSVSFVKGRYRVDEA